MKEKKSIQVKGIKKLEKIEMKETNGGLCDWAGTYICFSSYNVIITQTELVVGDDLLIIF